MRCSPPPSRSANFPSVLPISLSPGAAYSASSSITLERFALFTVEVRDHIMIAHSFRGAVFGPAQALHGATFVVDAAFVADALDANGIVVDIGRALDTLKEVLKPLNYKNLDDVPEFKSKNTTTEFLTKYIFDRLAHHAREGDLGRPGRELNANRASNGQAHVARRPSEPQ